MMPVVVALVLASVSQPDPYAMSPDSTRLYGRLTTVGGEVLEGYLRWGDDEAAPADVLDAAREVPSEVMDLLEALDPELAERRRAARSLRAFGVRITWEIDDLEGPPKVVAPLRLQHVARIEPIGDDGARVVLREGRELRLWRTGRDLGPGGEGVSVEAVAGAPVRIPWSRIRSVDFLAPPTRAGHPSARRLSGTVTTSDGWRVEGLVAWDRDEVVSSDVLDGRERGRRHEIPFADIRAISPRSSRSATVTLTSGEELVLRGTNDVNDENRGIEVSVPDFGRIVVPWGALDSVSFHEISGPSPPPVRPDRLRGTVIRRDGSVSEGHIRWGRGRAWGWELLPGGRGQVQVDVELGMIRTVIRQDGGGVEIRLRGGDALRLDRLDVFGPDDPGLLLEDPAGTAHLIAWEEVDRVEFRW